MYLLQKKIFGFCQNHSMLLSYVSYGVGSIEKHTALFLPVLSPNTYSGFLGQDSENKQTIFRSANWWCRTLSFLLFSVIGVGSEVAAESVKPVPAHCLGICPRVSEPSWYNVAIFPGADLCAET